VSIRDSSIVFIILLIASAGCNSSVQVEPTPTITPLIVTSTLTATLTPAPSEIPLPPPSQPTIAPVEGVASTQINVRAEPSTAGNVVGIISTNTKVEIIGKDPGENWWQINYPQGVDGKGWVTAQYIRTATKPEVPTIGGAEADPNNGNVAIVQQQLNVRSGPGTDFNSLGTLNPEDVVGLSGKDANGVWLQINFPAGAGPEGKGWVNAAFVQAQGVENLPIITETGLIVGTGTPTDIPFTPTPTIVPAWEDHDSSSNPIASVIFDPTGTQLLIYNGDVSTPQGDSEDWIAFKPDGSPVFVSLECIGGGSIKVEMTGNHLPKNTNLACGDQTKRILVKAGSNYLIHVVAVPSVGNLQHINYTLKIKTRLS